MRCRSPGCSGGSSASLDGLATVRGQGFLRRSRRHPPLDGQPWASVERSGIQQNVPEILLFRLPPVDLDDLQSRTECVNRARRFALRDPPSATAAPPDGRRSARSPRPGRVEPVVLVIADPDRDGPGRLRVENVDAPWRVGVGFVVLDQTPGFRNSGLDAASRLWGVLFLEPRENCRMLAQTVVRGRPCWAMVCACSRSAGRGRLWRTLVRQCPPRLDCENVSQLCHLQSEVVPALPLLNNLGVQLPLSLP